jgi:oxygen-independent coproporphyrinogen-3 oxidase
VRETARQAALLGPDRIAVFGYAHVPWFKKHQKMIRDEDLPDIDARYDQALAMSEGLCSNGYEMIGLDHYARHGDPMIAALHDGTLRRNFQGYTVDPADALMGFGCSAISSMPQGFAQSSRDMARWATAIDAGELPLDRGVAYTKEDLMRAEIIEKLMCFLRARPEEIARRHGFDPESISEAWDKLKPLEADGLCRVEDGEVIVPEERRLFVRTVAAARIMMPRSHVRLSAGRTEMSDELQALCFLAGANSLFYGERLLTTDNPETDRDKALFERLGLSMEQHVETEKPPQGRACHRV